MPIRPALRHFYRSAVYAQARAATLDRARHHCERCGKQNGRFIWTVWDGSGRWWSYLNRPPRDIPARLVRVVLTVAHLNQDPGDNCPSNLAALCQRCHLLHDQKQHQANALVTRLLKRPQGVLFEEMLQRVP